MAKFEKGRKCLILRCDLNPKLIGKEVTLNQRYEPEVVKHLKHPCWTVLPPQLHSDGREMDWRECHLMPTDDPDLNRELSAEDNTDIVKAHVKALDPQFSVAVELDRIASELDKLAKLADEWLQQIEHMKRQEI